MRGGGYDFLTPPLDTYIFVASLVDSFNVLFFFCLIVSRSHAFHNVLNNNNDIIVPSFRRARKKPYDGQNNNNNNNNII